MDAGTKWRDGEAKLVPWMPVHYSAINWIKNIFLQNNGLRIRKDFKGYNASGTR
jgi:hypothetical protein